MDSIEDLKYKVIGCAINVAKTLGVGLLEKVYGAALEIELQENNIIYQREFPLPVFYKGKCIGDFRADFVIDQRLILELKAVSCILPEHEVQLVNYLTILNIDYGLILNFGESPLGKRSKTRIYHKTREPK